MLPASTRHWIAWGLAALLLGAGALVWRIARSPQSALLISEGGAQWIRLDVPPSPVARPTARNLTFFRWSFSPPNDRSSAVLTIRALGSCSLHVNGRPVSLLEDDATGTERRRVDLGPYLEPGHQNTLLITVANPSGFPVLLAYSDDLDLRTNGTWPASPDSRRWTTAALATARKPFAISGAFPTTFDALASIWPFLMVLFAAGGMLVGLRGRHRTLQRAAAWPIWSPGRFRIVLMGAWVVLCANNMFKVPAFVGFDVSSHYDYIEHLAVHHSIPLPGEGWQFFQSPGYYLASLPLYLLFSALFSEQTVMHLLRVVPLACGLVQIEMVFRTLKLLWPGERLLVNLGLVVGGVLPMQIYISQVVGNEPLAGCLTSTVIYLCVRLLAEPAGPSLARRGLALGAAFGGALLTKVTIVLLAPAVLGVLLYRAVVDLGRSARIIRPALWFAGSSAAIAGWYYVRNWIVLGRPFVGGWDPDRGYSWWQDPGYRVPADFLHFGQALVRPIYSSLFGFWDGLYSTFWLDGYLSSMTTRETAPPWNYSPMLALSPLSLPMCLLGLAGVLAALRSAPGAPIRKAVAFAVACIGIYWAAVLYLFLRLPIYSTVKATYTLGLLPCYVLVITAGLAILWRRPLVQAAAAGYVCAWAGCSYVAFFVT